MGQISNAFSTIYRQKHKESLCSLVRVWCFNLIECILESHSNVRFGSFSRHFHPSYFSEHLSLLSCGVYTAASTDFSRSRISCTQSHMNEIKCYDKNMHRWEFFGKLKCECLIHCMQNSLIAKQSKNTKFVVSVSLFLSPNECLRTKQSLINICSEIYGIEWKFMVGKLRSHPFQWRKSSPDALYWR